MKSEIPTNSEPAKENDYYNSNNLIFLRTKKELDGIYSSLFLLLDLILEAYCQLKNTKHFNTIFESSFQGVNIFILEIKIEMEKFLNSNFSLNQTMISKNCMVLEVGFKILENILKIIKEQINKKRYENEIIIQSLVSINSLKNLIWFQLP